MYSDNILTNYLNEINSSYYNCDVYLPSTIKSSLLYYRKSTFNLLGCKDNKLYFYANNNSYDYNTYADLIVFDVDLNTFYNSRIVLSNSELLGKLQSFVISYPTSSVFNGDNYSDSFLSRVKFNSSYTDDFIHSNHPSEYLSGLVYFFIPILLFIIGIKVFRKGLFK